MRTWCFGAKCRDSGTGTARAPVSYAGLVRPDAGHCASRGTPVLDRTASWRSEFRGGENKSVMQLEVSYWIQR